MFLKQTDIAGWQWPGVIILKSLYRQKLVCYYRVSGSVFEAFAIFSPAKIAENLRIRASSEEQCQETFC